MSLSIGPSALPRMLAARATSAASRMAPGGYSQQHNFANQSSNSATDMMGMMGMLTMLLTLVVKLVTQSMQAQQNNNSPTGNPAADKNAAAGSPDVGNDNNSQPGNPPADKNTDTGSPSADASNNSSDQNAAPTTGSDSPSSAPSTDDNASQDASGRKPSGLPFCTTSAESGDNGQNTDGSNTENNADHSTDNNNGQASHSGSSLGQEMAASAKHAAASMGTVGWCYSGVKKALRPFGINLDGVAAADAAPQLARNPHFREVHVTGRDLNKLPAGDVFVWAKSASHPYGHIGVTLGDGREASDHIQRQTDHLTQSVRVFEPMSASA